MALGAWRKKAGCPLRVLLTVLLSTVAKPTPQGASFATLPLNLTNLLKLFAISQTPGEFFSLPPWGAPKVCGRRGKGHEVQPAGNLRGRRG